MSGLPRMVGQCPACGHAVEVQSELEGYLNHTYSISAVPIEMAIELQDQRHLCGHCGQEFEVYVEDLNAFLPVTLRQVEGGEEYR